MYWVAGVAAVALIAAFILWRVIVSLDRPPGVATPIEEGWTARWDDKQVEILEGILEMRDGRPVCVVHYPTARVPEVVYRLSGQRSEELMSRVGAASLSDETAARARYLDILYPRLETLLRARWEIDSRDALPRRAGDVGIRLGSPLFVRIEVRAARVEASSDGRVSDVRREAWVDRILEIRDLS